MSSQSTIEWTDATWNPLRGCTKTSPGCTHCYAETFAERFRGVKGHPYEQGFDLRMVPGKLGEPLRWRKPKMIFVNSMSDLFHEGVPEEYIAAVAKVMVAAKWHTYQVLTKRSGRLREMLNGGLLNSTFLNCRRVNAGPGECKAAAAAVVRAGETEARPGVTVLPEHIWWGVSVEDRKYGLPRSEDLRNADAGVRFLSVEPLLEDLGTVNLAGIHWVIVGGESGPGARPMKKEWVVSLRDQCRSAGVPFFFKQWGGVRKAAAGRMLDGRTYDEIPARGSHAVMAVEECVAVAAEIEAGVRNVQLVELGVNLPEFETV